MSTSATENPDKKSRKILLMLPLAAFLGLAALFLYRLGSGGNRPQNQACQG